MSYISASLVHQVIFSPPTLNYALSSQLHSQMSSHHD